MVRIAPDRGIGNHTGKNLLYDPSISKKRKIHEKQHKNSCYNPVRKEEDVMPGNIESVTAAIDYIESYLQEKPDLERIVEAVHYSK